MPAPKPDACTVNGNSAVGRSRNIVDSLGLSQIRLTGFCSDNLAATIEPGSHDHRDRDATVDVERVVFANVNIGVGPTDVVVNQQLKALRWAAEP